jgi:hypothetical protein
MRLDPHVVAPVRDDRCGPAIFDAVFQELLDLGCVSLEQLAGFFGSAQHVEALAGSRGERPTTENCSTAKVVEVRAPGAHVTAG